MGNEFSNFFLNKNHIASVSCTNYDPEYTNKLLQFIERSGAKGVAVITSGNYTSASALKHSIKKLSVPIIIGGKPLSDFKNTQIITDEAKGVSDAVHYLYSKGHRRIAYNGNKEGFYSAVIRYQAFHKACIELELNIEHCPNIDKTDILAMRKLKTLFSNDHAPTAILAASELIALNIYELLSIINLKIPDDIAVIALEGGTLAPSFETPLTTVEFPGKELGKQLAKTLWEQARGDKRTGIIKIPPKLIIRSSCGANKNYLRHDYLRSLIK
jgi:DNA-binding LacI/PurR family transcriptional regulator